MTPSRQQILPLAIGAAALLVCGIGCLFDLSSALRAYLLAWLFFLSITLGAMAVLMLQHLTGGAWGWLVRRLAEAAAMTLPLLALLFIPIALGLRQIFPWARAGDIETSAILAHRRLIFTIPMVLGRVAIYFIIWIFLAWRMRRLSLAHDRSGDPTLLARLRRISAAGLVVYFITMSLAAVDWIASREVDWYSSTFGLLVIVGQGVAGVAFVILILALLRDRSPLKELAEPDRVHDLGNLLLTLIILWSYVAFAQYLVIWIGNTQDDLLWYHHRSQGGWAWAGLALILFHFALPFVLLLFQESKRRLRVLGAIAGGVLCLRWLDVLWMVAPSSMGQQPGGSSWMDLIAPIGVGGVWIAFFLWLLYRRPLVPLGFAAALEPISYDSNEQGQPVT